MALINRAGQEISAKVVYYGPGLSGKTTNLEILFKEVPEDRRGKMISMKTRTDRTLFFDLLPMNADPIRDYQVRILLYTVPGQVYYNATRRLVLKGVDAMVFVADCQKGKMEENLESLDNLRQNLEDMDLKLEDMPWVIQYNKRDLPDIASIEEMERSLNPQGVPWFEAVANQGDGVKETLQGVAEILRPMLETQLDVELGLAKPAAPAPAPAQTSPGEPVPSAGPDSSLGTAPDSGPLSNQSTTGSGDAAPPPLRDPAQSQPAREGQGGGPRGSNSAEDRNLGLGGDERKAVDIDALPEPLVVDAPVSASAMDTNPGLASDNSLGGLARRMGDISSTGDSQSGTLGSTAGSDPSAAPGDRIGDDEFQSRHGGAQASSGAALPAPPGSIPAPPPPAPPRQEAPPAAAPAPQGGSQRPQTHVISGSPGQPAELLIFLPRHLLQAGELRLRLMISEESPAPAPADPPSREELLTSR